MPDPLFYIHPFIEYLEGIGKEADIFTASTYLSSMSLFTVRGLITITCHKRITPYLVLEVEALGFNT